MWFLNEEMVMKREEFYYDSRDGQSKIHAVKWIPDAAKPLAILQISHGMAEYILRYDEFAKFLAEKGILVTGSDHLGHGLSRAANKPYGYFCSRDAATVVVRDVHRLKKIVQEENPGVPYFILGHSMGSFILRNYLCRYGSGIDGAVIVGTAHHPRAVTGFGIALAGLLQCVQGEEHPSKLLNILAFGSCRKRVKNAKTLFDWVCSDEAVVKRYIDDPLCGFTFTLNGFRTLFELIEGAGYKKNLMKIPSGLPILMLSGEQDAIGNYGKGVRKVYDTLKSVGIENVTLKLYPQDRHEILNEEDKEQVFEDILQFIGCCLRAV